MVNPEGLLCVSQFFGSYIADSHIRAQSFCGYGCQHTDGSGTDNENLVIFCYICPCDAVIADAEGFDQCQCFRGESLAVIDPFNRHCDIFRKGTFSLNTHGLVGGAAVHQASLAGVAFRTVEVWIAGYYHALFKALVIRLDLYDLGGEFMARCSGI